ncbi:MAG: VOC family protein [Actinomycetota bacterium]|nr:VOC family protein [Actinomycetota bacterium]
MARAFQVSFDAEHPGALLRFWCAVLHYELEPLSEAACAELEAMGIDPARSDGMFAAAVDPAGIGPRLLAQRVPEGKTAKNRLHLDVRVGGREAVAVEVERLVALGATYHGTFDEHGSYWAVLTDPEGNEFCVG